MTGGPDGDLGSNEMLLCDHILIGVCNGSGVLYDPQGIDRQEILRLAKLRKTIASFDRSKLSKQGFVVLVDDRDAKLPDGT